MKRYFKRTASLLLALSMLIALVACGGDVIDKVETSALTQSETVADTRIDATTDEGITGTETAVTTDETVADTEADVTTDEKVSDAEADVTTDVAASDTTEANVTTDEEDTDMTVYTDMAYGVFSANEWMYPDGNTALGKKDIRVLAAGGSVAAAQILCDSQKVSFQWLPDKEAPLWAPEVNRLISVYVDRNTAPVDTTMLIPQGTVVDYVTRLAPYSVFDAMEPMTNGTAEAAEGELLGLYLRFPTDNVAAGVYRGTLRLTDENNQRADISVEVTVSSVSVPEERTLKVTNWYNVLNMATYHNVELWSEAHWSLIEEYGRLMSEMRQTHIWVPTNIIDAKKENGSYIFDFSKAERLIRLYMSLGMEYIEGAPFFSRNGWSNTDFYVSIEGESVSLFSNEGRAYAEAYHKQWYELLKKNGWLDITVQHICDEPSAHCKNNYMRAATMVRMWMPGIKTIEATELPDIDGALDVWVPKSLDYSKRQEVYDSKLGVTADELWYYTCCFPGGEYLNRMLDMELIRTRYLHWANMLYGLTGYLHWGLNQYHHITENGVFTGACTPKKNGVTVSYAFASQNEINNNALPAGDTHIVYPLGKQVLRSVRSEMMRKGCEDYELFALLKAKDEAAMNEILTSCVRSFTDFEKDTFSFDVAYKLLLTTLEAPE